MKSTLVIFALFFQLSLFAQSDNIIPKPDWKVGNHWKYQQTTEFLNAKRNIEIIPFFLEYEFKVIEVNPSGYLMEFILDKENRIKKILENGGSVTFDPEIIQQIIIEDEQILFHTDKNGHFLKFDDSLKVYNNLKLQIDNLAKIEFYESYKLDSNVVGRILDQLNMSPTTLLRFLSPIKEFSKLNNSNLTEMGSEKVTHIQDEFFDGKFDSYLSPLIIGLDNTSIKLSILNEPQHEYKLRFLYSIRYEILGYEFDQIRDELEKSIKEFNLLETIEYNSQKGYLINNTKETNIKFGQGDTELHFKRISKIKLIQFN